MMHTTKTKPNATTHDLITTYDDEEEDENDIVEFDDISLAHSLGAVESDNSIFISPML